MLFSTRLLLLDFVIEKTEVDWNGKQASWSGNHPIFKYQECLRKQPKIH